MNDELRLPNPPKQRHSQRAKLCLIHSFLFIHQSPALSVYANSKYAGPTLRYVICRTVTPIHYHHVQLQDYVTLANALVVLSSTSEDGDMEVRISLTWRGSFIVLDRRRKEPLPSPSPPASSEVEHVPSYSGGVSHPTSPLGLSQSSLTSSTSSPECTGDMRASVANRYDDVNINIINNNNNRTYTNFNQDRFFKAEPYRDTVKPCVICDVNPRPCAM
uniref:Uncharacterized protein n=1 Tax=Timema cristinae TaxID=61476 RepID=A0A7R9CFX5_TIMCR|nr:unnamed protein product [Timema cristinae]